MKVERDRRWLDLQVKVKEGQRLTVVRFASAHTAQSWHSAVWRAPTSLEQGHDHTDVDDHDDQSNSNSIEDCHLMSHLMIGANDL